MRKMRFLCSESLSNLAPQLVIQVIDIHCQLSIKSKTEILSVHHLIQSLIAQIKNMKLQGVAVTARASMKPLLFQLCLTF